MLKPFLKTCLFLSAAVLVVIAAGYTSAPTLAAGQDSSNPVKPTAASQEKAKKMYNVDCAVCHNQNGDGKTDLAKDMSLTMPDWTDPKTLAGKSDKDLYESPARAKTRCRRKMQAAPRMRMSGAWLLFRGFSKGHVDAPAAPAAPAAAPTNFRFACGYGL